MAYMGRGERPSISGNNTGDITDNSTNKLHRMYYPWWLFRRYYYIPLDNTYVVMQMIVTFLILIIRNNSILNYIQNYNYRSNRRHEKTAYEYLFNDNFVFTNNKFNSKFFIKK